MESHLNLYNHQLISVENMETLEKEKKIMFENDIIETKIGVNADKTGYGKCLGLDTPIIMYNGDIKMVQDVDVGDLLMGDNSTPRTVLSTTTGVETMYKLIQSNGDNYIVNSSHILSLAVNKKTIFRFYKKKLRVLYFDTNKLKFVSKNFKYGQASREKTKEEANKFVRTLKFPIIDIPLLDYLNLPSNIRRNLKGVKAAVDNWNNEYDLIFPSFLGLWFGLWLTNKFSNFREVYEHINKNYSPYERMPHKKEVELFCFNYNLDIDNPTFIPTPYKINNIFVRRLFITRFFIVCDFTILDRPRNSQLLEDIHFINNSLGFFTSLSSIKVEKLEEDVYYGFTIDGNHRFLLGDFTVTHNTLSMVSLVYNDKMSWNMDESYCETVETIHTSSHIKEIQHRHYHRIDTTLVLASQSIVKQWMEEFNKTPLSVQLISTKKAVENIDAVNYDVIVITPTMFNSYVNKYKDLAWKRFIFDDAQTVRISKMVNIIAGFIWFVSATPIHIPYFHSFHSRSTGFMRNMFHYTSERIFNEIIIKNSDSVVEQSFAMPQTINNYYKCSDRMYNTIKGIVNDKILELISAGNIQGAIKSLGGSETSNIKELVKQKKEEEIKELEKKIEILTIQSRTNKIPAVQTEINRIKSQINELDTRFSNVLESDCNICLDKIKNPVMEPNCQNIMCSECLLTWLKTHSTCPLCRIETDVSKFVYIKNEKEIQPISNEEYNNIPCSKVDTVIKIIRNNPLGKIIVFSEYDQTFTPIRNILSNHNISFGEIKGTVEIRDSLIQKFKNGSIQVIFLNANFNGAGINLQETTDIIVFHEMENNLLTQIVGRANRIGRKLPLNLHYLQLS